MQKAVNDPRSCLSWMCLQTPCPATMRGQLDLQSSMFHYFSPDSRVPADHPLRRVNRLADRALGAISGELDALYSSGGRPSIPPERLLKAQLLIALYSVRSDRQFCEQLDYNILFRWFLDMDLGKRCIYPIIPRQPDSWLNPGHGHSTPTRPQFHRPLLPAAGVPVRSAATHRVRDHWPLPSAATSTTPHWHAPRRGCH